MEALDSSAEFIHGEPHASASNAFWSRLYDDWPSEFNADSNVPKGSGLAGEGVDDSGENTTGDDTGEDKVRGASCNSDGCGASECVDASSASETDGERERSGPIGVFAMCMPSYVLDPHAGTGSVWDQEKVETSGGSSQRISAPVDQDGAARSASSSATESLGDIHESPEGDFEVETGSVGSFQALVYKSSIESERSDLTWRTNGRLSCTCGARPDKRRLSTLFELREIWLIMQQNLCLPPRLALSWSQGQRKIKVRWTRLDQR